MKRGRKPKNFGRKSGPNMKRGRKPKNFERKAEENISYDIPEKIIEKMDLMQNFNQVFVFLLSNVNDAKKNRLIANKTSYMQEQ